jgi:hypothetical protein
MNMKMNKFTDFFILLMGILSYLYLLFKLHTHKNINFIILYFATLVIGYFIVGKYIFLLNIIFIIYDVFFANLIEQYAGATKDDATKDDATNDEAKYDDDWDNGMAHSTDNAEEMGAELTAEEDPLIDPEETDTSETATSGNAAIERQKKDKDFESVKGPKKEASDFLNN